MCLIEIYKPIAGFPMYEVSNLANVRNSKTMRVLEQTFCEDDNRKVDLRNGSIKKTFAVHRLVALHFVPNPNGYKNVYRKDKNKDNNWAENLYWGKGGNNKTKLLHK